MTTFALTNEMVVINSVDLSDHCNNGQATAEADQLDSTCFGPGGWRTYLGGLKAGTLSFDFLDDFASGSVDATLWAAFNAGVSVTFEVRPVNAARSTTNPAYTGSLLPTQWNVGGQLGTLAAKSVQYPITGALTRQTS